MLTIICHQKAKKSKNLTSDQYRELSKRIKETYIFVKKKIIIKWQFLVLYLEISLVLSDISNTQIKKKNLIFLLFYSPICIIEKNILSQKQ